MSLILGIDPGTRMTGVGLIKKEGQKLAFIACDTLKTPDDEMPIRLQYIFDGISDYMRKYQPSEVAIETVFMHKNPQSALKLGQARGVAMVAATIHQAKLYEYSAREIKQAVVGFGAGQKEQVQHMVRHLLCLAQVPQSDAADALAVAICHAHANSTQLNFSKRRQSRRRRVR